MVLLLAVGGNSSAAESKARNVILVTIDGLRWQEVFSGAEEALMNKEHGGVPDNTLEALRRDFLADSAEARRRKLMPFFWDVIVPRGQAYGNRALGSKASVRNPQWFSYPGYNEILTGRVDPLITSNAPIPNRNVTVLEWLNGRPGYERRVAACAEWSVFAAIINVGRSRLPVWVTQQRSSPGIATPRLRELEELMADIPPIAPDEHYDAFVYRAGVDMFDTRRPRVFLLAFGEPDAWAHQRRYDRYLHSIQRCDRFLRQLWEKLQALPDYRDSTALLLSPDHGRGVLGSDWTSHGAKVPRADETWLAAMGPSIQALGERRETPAVYQAQIAATVAAVVGENFKAAFAEADEPIADIVRRP